MSERFESMRAY